jgi:dTDP-4-amino-4,6-dideoxygalactose transaminase
MKKINFFKPYYNNKEIKAVNKCIRSGWLTQGQLTQQYEQMIKDLSGYTHVIACAHAAAGLFLALRTSGIPEGSTILVPTYTFTASASIVSNNNYELKLCDINPNTYCVDIDIINRELERDNAIAGLINVDMFGYQNNIDVSKLFRPITIINDCAHCVPHNLQHDSQICVISTYANKTISTGEGGVILLNDDRQAKRIKTLLNHGIEKNTFERYKGETSKKLEYDIVDEGWKFNFTDLNASIGIEQLKKLDTIINKRKQVVDWYLKYLYLDKVEIQKDINSENHHRHLFVIKVPFDKREFIINKLAENGIQTSWHYKCLHKMSYYKDNINKYDYMFHDAIDSSVTSISLPFYTGLKKSEVKYICKVLNNLL